MQFVVLPYDVNYSSLAKSYRLDQTAVVTTYGALLLSVNTVISR